MSLEIQPSSQLQISTKENIYVHVRLCQLSLLFFMPLPLTFSLRSDEESF